MRPSEYARRWYLSCCSPNGSTASCRRGGSRIGGRSLVAGLRYAIASTASGDRTPLTRRELDSEVLQCFRGPGLRTKQPGGAPRFLINRWTFLVAGRKVEPYHGSKRLWQLSNAWWGKPEWDRLGVLVGLTSEWKDYPSGRAQLEAAMTSEARKLLDEGDCRWSAARRRLLRFACHRHCDSARECCFARGGSRRNAGALVVRVAAVGWSWTAERGSFRVYGLSSAAAWAAK